MTTFAKITAKNIETISALDLRSEAVETVERGEVVWYRRSGEPNAEATQIAVFDNTRVGVCYGGNAVWGESYGQFDDGVAGENWRVLLDERDAEGDEIWLDADGNPIVESDAE